ncbi:homeobox unc-4-like protein isoform C [Alligator mississippiensis]|uniref:Homeobox unc-4-like protein isoform C n=1 Tax=Alligator mississippiensis TaxID=8496 RepID=A0A151N1T7_ALLMI|nr:homeobox unc-4-like protein isoform C [Alligator mississippiensis]
MPSDTISAPAEARGAEAIKDFRTHTVNNQINGMIRHDSLGLELLPRKSAGVLPLASEKAGSGLQGWIWHRNWHRLPHRTKWLFGVFLPHTQRFLSARNLDALEEHEPLVRSEDKERRMRAPCPQHQPAAEGVGIPDWWEFPADVLDQLGAPIY